MKKTVAKAVKVRLLNITKLLVKGWNNNEHSLQSMLRSANAFMLKPITVQLGKKNKTIVIFKDVRDKKTFAKENRISSSFVLLCAGEGICVNLLLI